MRGDCSGLFGRIQKGGEEGRNEEEEEEEAGGEFAVVAHDIICFVEGGSQGHSKRRGGKD